MRRFDLSWMEVRAVSERKRYCRQCGCNTKQVATTVDGGPDTKPVWTCGNCDIQVPRRVRFLPLTQRQRLKIVLRVAARRHEPKDKTAALRLFEEVVDGRAADFSDTLEQIDRTRSGFKRLCSEVWNELGRDGGML